MRTRVLQGNLVLPDRIVRRGQLVLEDGQIASIVDGEPHYTPTHDYGEAWIVPGFIDLHMHGIAGADFMDGTGDSLGTMCRQLVMHGVTGFLPTTVTESLDRTRRAIVSAREYLESPSQGGAQVLGIHLEGPFLNRQFKGMQRAEHILEPDLEVARDLLALGDGHIVRMSLAPERTGASALITVLREAGVHVSIAHTGATFDDVLAAIRLGVTQVTHCFNAMTPLHHRHPGVAGAAMLCDELYVELIADGIHVHPAAMRLLVRCKGRTRVLLVTDSMLGTDMPDGQYRFGGYDVNVAAREARLHDGRLAGSTLTMERAVRNLVEMCDVPLLDAVYMASSTPAEAIGIGHRKGRIAPGLDADLAVLDTHLQPLATWIAGRPAFESDAPPAYG